MYHEEHKEKKQTYDRNYRELNKEIIQLKNKPQKCECGGSCGLKDKARHLRSLKHQQFYW